MTQINTYKLDYESLVEWMQGRATKKLAHNTYCLLEDDHIDVRYHSSIIASIYNDRIILSNDGFFTSTTKERLNWFINPYRYNISQVNFEWFIYKYGEWDKPEGKFTGECTLWLKDDKFTGLAPMDDTTRKEEIKRIKRYAKQYVKRLVNGEIDKPSNGDCLYCAMNFPDSYDHIDSHIEESYYVPSLIIRATEHKPVSRIAYGLIGEFWQSGKKPDFMVDVIERQFYASLWAYMLYCYDQDNRK